MTREDATRWDARYARAGPPGDDEVVMASRFVPYAACFPTRGAALELACGRGALSVCLARRGLDVWGLDVSTVAIGYARDLARRHGVADRARFDVVDLDDGLPDGPPVALLVAHRFRDERLDDAIRARLAPGGVLALSCLSEVGAGPGRYRAAPGELLRAFAGLEVIDAGEGEGEAWIVARGPGPG